MGFFTGLFPWLADDGHLPVFQIFLSLCTSVYMQISSPYKDTSQFRLVPTLINLFYKSISLKVLSKHSHILKVCRLGFQVMDFGETQYSP